MSYSSVVILSLFLAGNVVFAEPHSEPPTSVPGRPVEPAIPKAPGAPTMPANPATPNRPIDGPASGRPRPPKPLADEKQKQLEGLLMKLKTQVQVQPFMMRQQAFEGRVNQSIRSNSGWNDIRGEITRLKLDNFGGNLNAGQTLDEIAKVVEQIIQQP